MFKRLRWQIAFYFQHFGAMFAIAIGGRFVVFLVVSYQWPHLARGVPGLLGDLWLLFVVCGGLAVLIAKDSRRH